MKLSEAIRKGSEGKEQFRGWYAGADGAVCALGAAMIGVGLDPDAARSFDLHDRIKGLPEYAMSEVIRLNDEEGKTFEEIAAWLEEAGL